MTSLRAPGVRRSPSAELCRCSHRWADHRFNFPDPCGIQGCGCKAFAADGLPPDPDEKHDRERPR